MLAAYILGRVVVPYVIKLLENKPVARYLRQRHSEVLAEFEVIVQTASLDQ